MKKSLLGSYRSDASRLRGKVLDVVHPESIEEVRDVVLKNDRVVIRGAGTGLAGGCVPQGEVVLDLSKLTGINEFNKDRRRLKLRLGLCWMIYRIICGVLV